MENVNKEQLVSLKVMRLLKPSLCSALPCFTENEHFSDNFTQLLLNQAFDLKEHKQINSSINSSLSDFLVIPQIFGQLYIGETFTSYICLHNHSIFKVKELSIKIELQTLSQKISLPFKSKIDYVEEFEADHKMDGIVEYDVKELGNHILICIVNYVNDKSEKMNFKKFYKFIVSKPFEIIPRSSFIEHISSLNTVLFEAQIQNITNSLLFMEKVNLEPLNHNILVELLHQSMIELKKYNNFGFIQPSEVKQYLFRVTFKNLEKEIRPLTIGKLDITWRNSLGEYGHLQTHPLQTQEIILKKEIQINVSDLPENCLIYEPINLNCHILNNSNRLLDLSIKIENEDSNGYIWNCRLVHHIAKLEPKAFFKLNLNIIPIKTGFLNISGISITDIFLKRIHEFTEIANIFVK